MAPLLYNGDCIDEMKKIPDGSIDMVWTDLPYATNTFGKCTDCHWDNAINLPAMWDEFMRIKKLNAPIFFSCNVKLGFDLIRTAPKKCPFRYDLIWVKSAPTSFLSARRMPMRKHELIYVFYEKLPFYDLSSHTHKFKKTKPRHNKKNIYGMKAHADGKEGSYTPPLPKSVITDISVKKADSILNIKRQHYYDENGKRLKDDSSGSKYTPPLPLSVIKDDNKKGEYISKAGIIYNGGKPLPLNDYSGAGRKNGESAYTPPLPLSVIKSHHKDTIYGDIDMEDFKGRNGKARYDPPLPVSVITTDNYSPMELHLLDKYELQGADLKTDIYGMNHKICEAKGFRNKKYEPPLPVSVVGESSASTIFGQGRSGGISMGKEWTDKAKKLGYEPPLPVSIMKEKVGGEYDKTIYWLPEGKARYKNNGVYEPPLPKSVIKNDNKKVYVPPSITTKVNGLSVPDCYNYTQRIADGKLTRGDPRGTATWEPKLPVSYIDGEACEICPVCSDYPDTILEINSKKGKHSTQKPTELIKWCLKYYSKVGDTILDCCMGSGSTGVACVEMNRNFVGIELDNDIFKVAVERIEIDAVFKDE